MVVKKLIDKLACLKDIEQSFTDSRKIVDTRNRIVNGYDSFSEVVIWVIVNRYLPILVMEVMGIRKRLEEE